MQRYSVLPVQGQERDLIILSTTATRPGSSASFVSDSQRLNVALTRARCHLVVVGAASVMKQAAPAFSHVLQWCRYALVLCCGAYTIDTHPLALRLIPFCACRGHAGAYVPPEALSAFLGDVRQRAQAHRAADEECSSKAPLT